MRSGSVNYSTCGRAYPQRLKERETIGQTFDYYNKFQARMLRLVEWNNNLKKWFASVPAESPVLKLQIVRQTLTGKS